jgi:hypothetical protein
VNHQLSNQSSTSYAINQRSVLVSITTQQSANHSSESDQLPGFLAWQYKLYVQQTKSYQHEISQLRHLQNKITSLFTKKMQN